MQKYLRILYNANLLVLRVKHQKIEINIHMIPDNSSIVILIYYCGIDYNKEIKIIIDSYNSVTPISHIAFLQSFILLKYEIK